ncbi:MAG: hypothetical protein OFPII_31880 [Osedax symbiont Rs1]|nr:MAG: hypothetical protein OFPII_31880 [Osedax symbiont Rs1]
MSVFTIRWIKNWQQAKFIYERVTDSAINEFLLHNRQSESAA